MGDDGKDISDDSASEVSHSVYDLTTKVEELNTALTNHDKLLRLAARERKEFQSKHESMLRELESARALVVVSNETECGGCALHMSNIATLQTKYATLIDERDELQSMSSLLGACQTCPGLQIELAEKNASIASIEKASLVSAYAPLVVCTM
jgi:excinuclease UvrABC ATPase subunit